MKLLRSRRILQKTSLRNTDGCVLWTLLRRPRRRSVRPRLLLMVQSSIHQRTLFYLRHIPLLLFLLLNLTVNLPIVSWLWGRGLVPRWLTKRRGRAASSCWRLGADVMRGVWLGHGDLCRLQTSKGSWNVWRSRKEMRCLTSILTCFPVRIPFFDAPAWRTCCWCYIYIYVYICINRGPPPHIFELRPCFRPMNIYCMNVSITVTSPAHLYIFAWRQHLWLSPGWQTPSSRQRRTHTSIDLLTVEDWRLKSHLQENKEVSQHDCRCSAV